MTSSSSSSSTIFITGGAGHIGRAIAKEWISRKARAVVLSDIVQAGLDAAVEELTQLAGTTSSPTVVKGIKADATIYKEIDAAIEQTVAEFGTVEYIFGNAGALGGLDIDLSEPKDPGEEWHNLYNSHFRTALNTIHAGIPRLAKSTASDKLLVVTSSASSQCRFSFSPVYGAAKAGVNHLVYNYAELVPEGVRLTSFAPNWVLTPTIAPWAPFLTGPKTLEETIAGFFSHVDDTTAHGIVTVHDPDGTLVKVEPRYTSRTDMSYKLAAKLRPLRDAAAAAAAAAAAQQPQP
ncbi:hypothetical protein V8E36_005382 [Tilletia maclaganii]